MSNSFCRRSSLVNHVLPPDPNSQENVPEFPAFTDNSIEAVLENPPSPPTISDGANTVVNCTIVLNKLSVDDINKWQLPLKHSSSIESTDTGDKEPYNLRKCAKPVNTMRLGQKAKVGISYEIPSSSSPDDDDYEVKPGYWKKQ